VNWTGDSYGFSAVSILFSGVGLDFPNKHIGTAHKRCYAMNLLLNGPVQFCGSLGGVRACSVYVIKVMGRIAYRQVRTLQRISGICS
jgi:hypothetical protein